MTFIKKIHRHSAYTLAKAPLSIVWSYMSEGLHGTLCGYVREKTSNHDEEVTCELCIRKLMTQDYE